MKNTKKLVYVFGIIVVLVIVIVLNQQGGFFKGDLAHIINTTTLSDRVTLDMKKGYKYENKLLTIDLNQVNDQTVTAHLNKNAEGVLAYIIPAEKAENFIADWENRQRMKTQVPIENAILPNPTTVQTLSPDANLTATQKAVLNSTPDRTSTLPLTTPIKNPLPLVRPTAVRDGQTDIFAATNIVSDGALCPLDILSKTVSCDFSKLSPGNYELIFLNNDGTTEAFPIVFSKNETMPATNNLIDLTSPASLLNQNVVNVKTNYLQKNSSVADLEKALKSRKEAMIKLMETDPDKANQFALSSDFSQNLPENLKDYIESPKTLAGQLTIIYNDDFFNNTNDTYKYIIHTADNEDIPIFAPNLPVQPNMMIKASGIYMKGVGLSATQQNVSISPGSLIPNKTDYRLLVIFYHDNNTQPAPNYVTSTNQVVQKLFFTGTDSMKNFFFKNTYGAINFSGTVLQTPIAVDIAGGYGTSALIATADPNKAYNFYSLIRLDSDYCQSSGTVGTTPVGGRQVGMSFFSSVCTDNFNLNPNVTQSAFTHEIGHNLGLLHANGYEGTVLSSVGPNPNHCTVNIPLPSNNVDATNCSWEYADDTVMGSGNMDLGPYQREKIGTNLAIEQVVPTNDSYTLYPIAKATIGKFKYQELQIQSTNGYYSLEYRTQNKNEIIIRFVPKINNINFFLNNVTYDTLRPQLLQEIADYSIFYNKTDYSLIKGDTYTDSSRNLIIKVVDLNPVNASINIRSLK